jgi:cold shock CspA family protein
LASGNVKSFNDLSGHGFIVPDESGVDLWVHQRNIVSEPATLREGERVEFDKRQAGMGPEAINVRSAHAGRAAEDPNAATPPGTSALGPTGR